MNDNPYSATQHTTAPQSPNQSFRFMLAFALLLAALAFFAHGLLLAGNYFTFSNNRLPPTMDGKIYLFSMIAIPIVISWVSFRASVASLIDSKKTKHRAFLAFGLIATYIIWFMFFVYR